MDFWQYLMLAVAVVSALAWRWNATAAALAFSYFAVQLWWLLAGNGMDAGELFMIDLFTAALIFCKAIARCEETEFKNAWHQFRCFARSPTVADRAILAVFPVMWIIYVLTISEYSRWWLLYVLAMGQFLLALGEAYAERRKAKAPIPEPDIPSSGLMFAAPRAWRWST
jgi:hypothetical protein